VSLEVIIVAALGVTLVLVLGAIVYAWRNGR